LRRDAARAATGSLSHKRFRRTSTLSHEASKQNEWRRENKVRAQRFKAAESISKRDTPQKQVRKGTSPNQGNVKRLEKAIP